MAVINRNSIPTFVGDPVQPLEKAARRVTFDLPSFFDDEAARSVLELSVDTLVSPNNLLLKSMYEFDLDSEQGINRLLELLPILDTEIVKTVVQEIWPGYPVDSLTFDHSLARAEIRGYILDFLEGHGTQEEDIDHRDEAEPDGGAETPETRSDGGPGGAESQEAGAATKPSPGKSTGRGETATKTPAPATGGNKG